MTSNLKIVFAPETMSQEGWALLRARPDIRTIAFDNMVSSADFRKALAETGAHAAILGATPYGAPELEAARHTQVVARIGVGYDAIDVPALSRARVPLMTAGTANSASVAECAMFMMISLAKHWTELDKAVKQNRWRDRWVFVPSDLLEKELLIIGFGRIGTRTAKRALAMEMKVSVYDPYVSPSAIKAAGCTPVTNLDEGLARADFVTLHCPKTPETVGLINAARLACMKPTAFLVNTARGGLVDEKALHAALTGKKLAGAGLDVFDKEPPEPDNPLFKLPNVLCAPHMAGVTREAMDRMAIAATKNVLSVFDGNPIVENVINKDVLS
ncbi:MAG: hydroxyacid dehydrogenase [Hyphomicrobiales bacterium]|nr:MAG: hydroxyacid dehydrogenase [Hyphomicrobiales bacterium]